MKTTTICSNIKNSTKKLNEIAKMLVEVEKASMQVRTCAGLDKVEAEERRLTLEMMAALQDMVISVSAMGAANGAFANNEYHTIQKSTL